MALSTVDTSRVRVNGIELNVAVAGAGTPLLLLHGWPHTWQLWSAVIDQLASTHQVIAPDLRGIGGSDTPATGYDAQTLADDALALLDAVGPVGAQADVMAIDAGVPPAFMLALRRPDRVRRLVLMESLLGTLPGAEGFLARGAPWWFGFHGVPGLAETVLVGHEREYLDYFYRLGTFDGRGIAPDLRAAFVAGYTGADALRGGFEHYRAMPANNALFTEAVADGQRLRVPTLAIGAEPVHDALARQLTPLADQLTSAVIADCGHLIPLDRPAELLGLVEPFLAAGR